MRRILRRYASFGICQAVNKPAYNLHIFNKFPFSCSNKNPKQWQPENQHEHQTNPTSSIYVFNKNQLSVLFVKKIGSMDSIELTLNAINIILKHTDKVYIENSFLDDIFSYKKKEFPGLDIEDIRNRVTVFENKTHEFNIDLIVTIGGDGTVLWASGLFQNRLVPPMVCFGKGTLGFMCTYNANTIEPTLNQIIEKIKTEGYLRVEKIMRLQSHLLPSSSQKQCCEGSSQFQPIHALNDVVVYRADSPYYLKLRIYVFNHLFTVSRCDGIIISNPNGSTAYSLSCGAPIIYATIRSLMLTPISPHSLSFRPILFPETFEMTIELDDKSKSNRAQITLDGKQCLYLNKGDVIKIKASPYDVQFVSEAETDTLIPWIDKMQKHLSWNIRFKKS